MEVEGGEHGDVDVFVVATWAEGVVVLVVGVIAEGADEDGGCSGEDQLGGSVCPQGECEGLVVLFWDGDLVWVVGLVLEKLEVQWGVVVWFW